MHFLRKDLVMLTGLKWLCLCIFCLGLSLSFIETPYERADEAYAQGMVRLNQAQSSYLSDSVRQALLGQAKEIFEVALEFNPKHSRAWKALGHTLQQSGQPMKAHLAYNVSAPLQAKAHRKVPQDLLLVQLSQAEIN